VGFNVSFKGNIQMNKREKIQLIRDSIKASKGPGKCRYVIGNKPGCIIGQIASRCGVPIETLKQWDESDLPRVEGVYSANPIGPNPSTALSSLLHFNDPKALKLISLFKGVCDLSYLQNKWDNCMVGLTLTQARKRLTKIFEQALVDKGIKAG
jgi:hypothetical protein